VAKKLSKSFVDSIPNLASGQMFYRDSELKGFGLRVGASTKTYIAESKVNGKVVRVTIGKHGVFTAEQARVEARRLLVEMAKGNNPNSAKTEMKARAVTVQKAFDEFLEARKALKPRTIYDYQRIMKTYLADWQNKPITSITKDMIARRHTKLSQPWEFGKREFTGSKAQANLTMRFLRALFNFAAAKYEDSQGNSLFVENPVRRLSQTRAWFRVERRQTVIKPHELPAWFKAVQELKSDAVNGMADVVRDYLLFLLLTGLRRNEAATLKWGQVDMISRTFTVLDTKNKEPHTLPMSDYVLDLLAGRREKAEEEFADSGEKMKSEYVFPGPGTQGYLIEPKKQKQKVIQASGVSFTLHDLRRTFLTIADSIDIPAYAVKRLANHKMTNDVTAGYIIADVERLRKPMQQITDYILRAAGVKPGAATINIEVAKSPRRQSAN
jgi:integrase